MNPFGFEAGPLAARSHDFALVPSRTSIEGAFERGIEEQTFVYLAAQLEEIHEKDSRVRWLSKQRGFVSNALIIPLRRAELARPGDVVLTSWASGSGMQRAIVVPGGSPESPKVRYLDLPGDGPVAMEPDALPKDTFHVLKAPFEVGSTIACRRDGRVEHLIVVKRLGERALVLGFGGKMRAVETSACVPLPLVPDVKPKDRVFVPNLGAFVPAEVESIDTSQGRVLARLDFGGETRQVAIGYTNVAVALPP